jgi:hypothetical protein
MELEFYTWAKTHTHKTGNQQSAHSEAKVQTEYNVEELTEC